MKPSHDPLSVAREIREQLASETRRLFFFFGAGTSMAAGLPGVIKLTEEVATVLQAPEKNHFENLLKELPKGSHVEMALDRIRTIRDLLFDDNVKKYDGLGSNDVKALDLALCQAISAIVRKPAPKGLASHATFVQWIRALHGRRDWPVEVFTTNYDLFMEQAMESCGVPYFDGFVGSVEAFFAPESVDAQGTKRDEAVYPPRAWTRLWKLHGSVNWHVNANDKAGHSRITRTAASECKPGNELAVFPSRDKYSQSRKLPFLALQDRMRRNLSAGESLLVMIGYSFSDQHLNEIIFQGLRSNPHLAAILLLFDDDDENIFRYGVEHRNLAIHSPTKACIGGITSTWNEPRKREDAEEWPFWDDTTKRFVLGDFNNFAKFLEVFIGFRPISSPNLTEEKGPGGSLPVAPGNE